MMTKALYYGLKSPQLWALNKPGYAASLVSTPLGKTQILDMKRDLDQPSNNYSSKAYLTNYENSRVPVFLPKECMSINPATIQSQYNCIIMPYPSHLCWSFGWCSYKSPERKAKKEGLKLL